MKKALSIILALAMMLVLPVFAFADESPYKDVNAGQKPEDYVSETAVYIPVYYKETNEGSVSPAEDFKFTVTAVEATDTAIALKDVPAISDFTVSFAKGEATKEGARKVKTLALPSAEDFGSVGVFTYEIAQTAGNTLGVTYDSTPTYLKLSVVELNGLKVIGAIHYATKDGDKIDGSDEYDFAPGVGITNEYAAAANDPASTDVNGLAVSKKVTGNLGDKTKAFDVNVTLTIPEGKTLTSEIAYSDDGEAKTVAFAKGETSAVVKITLKDGETVSFSNVPYGMTYAVEEANYTTEGYDKAEYDENKSGAIDAAGIDTVITNNKGVVVDTGVIVNSIPYIVLLVLVAAGAIVFFAKKRSNIVAD